MTGHPGVPSKMKPRLFTSCFNRASNSAKFDYWGGRKTLPLLCLFDYMDIETIEVFQNSHYGGSDLGGNNIKDIIGISIANWCVYIRWGTWNKTKKIGFSVKIDF